MKKLLICCLFGNTANSLAKKIQLLAEKRAILSLSAQWAWKILPAWRPLSTDFSLRRIFSIRSRR